MVAKAVVKKAVAKKAARRTISQFVRERLGKDIKYPADKLVKEVKAAFPKSRFDEKHAAWYRSGIRHGRIKKAR